MKENPVFTLVSTKSKIPEDILPEKVSNPHDMQV